MDQNISNNMTIASKLVSFFESAEDKSNHSADSDFIGNPKVEGRKLVDSLREEGISPDVSLGEPSIRKGAKEAKAMKEAGANFAIRVGRVVNKYQEYIEKIKESLNKVQLNTVTDVIISDYIDQLKNYGRELFNLLKKEYGDTLSQITAFSTGFNEYVNKLGLEKAAPKEINDFISYTLDGPVKYLTGIEEPGPVQFNTAWGNTGTSMISHDREFGNPIGNATVSVDNPERYLKGKTGSVKNPSIPRGDLSNDNTLTLWERICRIYMLARDSAEAYIGNLKSYGEGAIEREKRAIANNQLKPSFVVTNPLNKAKEYEKSRRSSLSVDDLGERDICSLIKSTDTLDSVRLTDEPKRGSIDYYDVVDLLGLRRSELRELPKTKITNGVMAAERLIVQKLADLVLEKFNKNTSYFIANNKDVEDYIKSDEVRNKAVSDENSALFDSLKNIYVVFDENKKKVKVRPIRYNTNDEVPVTKNKSQTPSPLSKPEEDADSLIKNKAKELGLKKPTEVSGSKEIKGTKDFKKHMELLWGMRSLPGFINRLRKNNSFYVEYVNSKLKENGYNVLDDLTPDQMEEIAKQLAAESTHDWVGKYLKDVQVVDGYKDPDKETSVAESILSFLDSL